MSDGTSIEWTDATVNAVNGCSVISPGCKHCYAMKQACRVSFRSDLVTKTAGGFVWTGQVYLHEPALLQPLRWTRPRRIFWNAHGDLFHENVPDEWIDRCFAVMALTPHHQHQVLTKRPERMRGYLEDAQCRIVAAAMELAPVGRDLDAVGITFAPGREGFGFAKWPLVNVWLGTSVEDQQRADERIPHLLATPAAVRFLSCEPLLGPVDLTRVAAPEDGGVGWKLNALVAGSCFEFKGSDGYWYDGDGPEHPALDWVIVGGESGHRARPMNANWARSLRDQCAAADVAFFFKQWGEWFRYGEIDADGCRNTRDRGERPGLWHSWGDGEFSVNIGKRQAGRRLDGAEHSGMPA